MPKDVTIGAGHDWHPSVLAFRDLHRRCEGRESKMLFLQRNKKVVAAKAQALRTRLFARRLPGGQRLSEFILEFGTSFLERRSKKLSLRYNPRCTSVSATWAGAQGQNVLADPRAAATPWRCQSSSGKHGRGVHPRFIRFL
jgi:hypothetical protein